MLRLAAITPPPTNRNTSDSAWFFGNAQTEAFAVHVRTLAAFLYPEHFQSKPDDVTAGHFFSSPHEWQLRRPKLSDALAAARKRSDKEVAHVTTARIAGTPPAKHWDVRTLLRELGTVLVLFATYAESERLGPKARDEIGRCADILAELC